MSDLGDHHLEGILVGGYQIPGVGREFALDIGQEALGAEEVKRFGAAQTKTQEVVQPTEVIHVRMSHENMADAQ